MSRQPAPSSSADQPSPGSGGLDGPPGPATSAGAAVRLWRCFRGLPTTMLIGALAAVDCGVTLIVGTARADPTKYTTFSDVTYVVRDGQSLKADVYQPVGDGPFPGVLCVHGGGWISGNKSHMVAIARRLAEEGYAVVAIDYRRAPQHKFPAQIEDCRAALEWMGKHAGQYKIDRKRLGVWGYSAGGQLAALLGAEKSSLKAVVAGGAPCDFRQTPPDKRQLAYWLGGTRRKLPKVYESASPAAFVSADDPPFFFYHGDRDFLVKIDQPRAMAAQLKEAGVPAAVYVVPKAGHMAAFFNRPAQDEAIKFLKKHLR